MKKSPDTSKFLLGSLLLTGSALISKLCGALFRIPLTSLLGGRGMGCFSTAYGLFLPLYAVLVTGISTACAKLTAERYGHGDLAGALYLRRAARLLFCGTGLLGTGLALLLAKPFVLLTTGEMTAYPAVLCIAPCVLLCSLTATERGCHEGICDMLPTALSQAAEALVKLLCGLWFCRQFLLHPPILLSDVPKECAGACGAVMGVTLSSFAGWMIMLLRGSADKKTAVTVHPPLQIVLKELIAILLPAAIGALVTDLTSLIDLLTVMRMLPSGCDPSFVYGSFMGMAVTVFGLIPSLTNMLAKSVLPCAAQCFARGDHDGTAFHAGQVLRLTALVSIPASCGLFVLSREALRFLFAGREAEITVAEEALRMLSPGLIFLCLTAPVFSLMQAMGRADLPVKLMLPGLAVKLGLNMLLLPKIGLKGAAIATSISYAVILFPALFLLRKLLQKPLHIGKFLFSAGLGGILCGAAAWVVFGRMGMFPQRLAFLCAVLAGIAVYAFVMAICCLPLTGSFGQMTEQQQRKTPHP